MVLIGNAPLNSPQPFLGYRHAGGLPLLNRPVKVKKTLIFDDLNSSAHRTCAGTKSSAASSFWNGTTRRQLCLIQRRRQHSMDVSRFHLKFRCRNAFKDPHAHVAPLPELTTYRSQTYQWGCQRLAFLDDSSVHPGGDLAAILESQNATTRIEANWAAFRTMRHSCSSWRRCGDTSTAFWFRAGVWSVSSATCASRQISVVTLVFPLRRHLRCRSDRL